MLQQYSQESISNFSTSDFMSKTEIQKKISFNLRKSSSINPMNIIFEDEDNKDPLFEDNKDLMFVEIDEEIPIIQNVRKQKSTVIMQDQLYLQNNQNFDNQIQLKNRSNSQVFTQGFDLIKHNTVNKLVAKLTEQKQNNKLINFENKLHQQFKSLLEIELFKTDYQIIEIINQNQKSIVFKCLNKYDDLYYVIKCLHLDDCKENIAQIQENFQKQVQMHNKTQISNVIKYYQARMEKGFIIIVMEYCNDTLLNQLDKQERFSETQVRNLIKHICLGLQSSQSNKISLHLKITSILYSNTQNYKISDFGLQQLIKKKSPQDNHDNIYELGKIIYKVMTHSDWYDSSRHFLKLQHLQHYSHSLKQLVQRMLTKDANVMPNVQQIIEALPSQTQIETCFVKNKNKKLIKQINEIKNKIRKQNKRKLSI